MKEKKKIKVNRVGKEIVVVKDLVFSPNDLLSKDQSIAKDTWCFVKL